MAPRILISSIAMDAEYSFYVKTIKTHARAFFKVIIFYIGIVPCEMIISNHKSRFLNDFDFILNSMKSKVSL